MLNGSWSVTDGKGALQTALALLNDAGDPGYRALRPTLSDLVTLPVAERGQHVDGIIAATRQAVDPEVPDEAVAAEVRRIVGPFLMEESVMALPSTLPVDTVDWDTARALRILWMAHGAGCITEQDAEPLVRGALDITPSGLRFLAGARRRIHRRADAVVRDHRRGLLRVRRRHGDRASPPGVTVRDDATSVTRPQ